MWALFLSESKVVMWFLFSKHYRRTWGHTSNWIFSGESVCVLFLWVMCWFVLVELCVGAYECVCLSTAILVCLMGFVFWRPLLRGSISPLALSSISGRLRFSSKSPGESQN